jgi:pimeloyl-ACP methyl ester carboxylesterase
VASPSLLRRFAKIHAPYRRLIWFEHSAHNPPFEEPEKFNTVLIEDILSLLGESVPTLTSNR